VAVDLLAGASRGVGPCSGGGRVGASATGHWLLARAGPAQCGCTPSASLPHHTGGGGPLVPLPAARYPEFRHTPEIEANLSQSAACSRIQRFRRSPYGYGVDLIPHIPSGPAGRPHLAGVDAAAGRSDPNRLSNTSRIRGPPFSGGPMWGPCRDVDRHGRSTCGP